MENPMLAVIHDLPHLLDNPDLVQRLLDDARADLDRNSVLLAVAAAHLRDCLAFEAVVRTLPEPTEEERAICALLVASGRGSYNFFLEKQWLLGQLVGALHGVRAFASARSRAHLIPGVLLTAISVAVVVYVSTWGAVVPGFRSFVRFAVLMLGFLFSSDRPPRGGG